MRNRAIFIAVLCFPVLVRADDNEADWSPRSFTVNLNAGMASTFQMPLGGSFGAGPDVTETLTASLNHAFLNGDSLSVFGWDSVDLPSPRPDWQSGLSYAAPLLRRGRQSLTLEVGVQRWLLPNVVTGAKDWLFSGNLTYGTKVKNIPLYISESSWSLVKSTLPTGSAIYTQVYTQHRLLKRRDFELLLRQGPAHSYSWGFYGLQGNCVLHYAGSVAAVWKGNTLSAEYRQQFGLQDKVPNAHYWEFSWSRQLFKLTQEN
ncbi:MAG TPA: hypothetical protein VMB85_00995 [Bryobacteraceae bacterium]|nr:hypothetical protein [Bryobacteraceae bacterium]